MILNDTYGTEQLWHVMNVWKKLNEAIGLMYQLDGDEVATMEGSKESPDYVGMAEKLEKVRAWLSEMYFDHDFLARLAEKELEREERNAE